MSISPTSKHVLEVRHLDPKNIRQTSGGMTGCLGQNDWKTNPRILAPQRKHNGMFSDPNPTGIWLIHNWAIWSAYLRLGGMWTSSRIHPPPKSLLEHLNFNADVSLINFPTQKNGSFFFVQRCQNISDVFWNRQGTVSSHFPQIRFITSHGDSTIRWLDVQRCFLETKLRGVDPNPKIHPQWRIHGVYTPWN